LNAIVKNFPGNCSSSHMVFPSVETASNSTFPPKVAEATMFTTFKLGFLMMIIPPFFNSLTTVKTALRLSFSDFAPVHTISPEWKISVAVFGLLILKTKPGVEYRPERFPGLIYRMDESKVVILIFAIIFASGDLVCTGARREQDVYDAVHKLHERLEEQNLIFYE
jgi:hypothetical protein